MTQLPVLLKCTIPCLLRLLVAFGWWCFSPQEREFSKNQAAETSFLPFFPLSQVLESKASLIALSSSFPYTACSRRDRIVVAFKHRQILTQKDSPKPVCIQNTGNKLKIWDICSTFLVSSFNTSDWWSCLISDVGGYSSERLIRLFCADF